MINLYDYKISYHLIAEWLLGLVSQAYIHPSTLHIIESVHVHQDYYIYFLWT